MVFFWKSYDDTYVTTGLIRSQVVPVSFTPRPFAVSPQPSQDNEHRLRECESE